MELKVVGEMTRLSFESIEKVFVAPLKKQRIMPTTIGFEIASLVVKEAKNVDENSSAMV